MTAIEYFKIAHDFIYEGEYEKAKINLLKGIEIDNSLEELWNGLAVVYAEQNNIIDSIEALKKAININPDNAFSWHLLGCHHKLLSNLNKSATYFRRSIDCDPTFTESYFLLGEVFFLLERHQDSASIFKELVNIDPTRNIAWYNLGNALTNIGNFQDAISAFNRAIDIEFNEAEYWLSLGKVYVKVQKYEKAFHSYEKAHAINPNLVEIQRYKGNLYLVIKKYRLAIEEFECYIENTNEVKGVELGNAWYGLGCSHMWLGNHVIAIDCFNNSISLNERSVESWTYLGACYTYVEEFSSAKESFAKAFSLNDKFPLLYYEFGNMLLKKEELEKAIASYQKGLLYFDGSPHLWYGLGNAYRDKSKKEGGVFLLKAQKCYVRSLCLFPSIKNFRAYLSTNRLKDISHPNLILKIIFSRDYLSSLEASIVIKNTISKCKCISIFTNFIRILQIEDNELSAFYITLHYFMGDPLETESLCRKLIQQYPNNLFAHYYWLINCTEWVKEQLPVIKSAEPHFNYYLDNKPTQNISTEEQEQRYYAALLLYADTDTVEAIECMEHIWMTHLPSAYFYLFLQFELEREQLFKKRLHSQKEEIKNRYANQKQQAKATAIKEEWEDDKLKYLLQEIIEKEERQLSNAKDLELISESEYRKILSDNAICQQVTQHIIEREIADEEQEPMKFAYGFAPQNLDPNRVDWWTPFFHYAHYFELSEAIGIFRLAAQAYNFEVKLPSELKPFWETWKIKESDIIRMQEDIRKHELERVGEAFLMESKKHYHTLRERVIVDIVDLKSEVNKLIFGIHHNTNLAKKRAIFDLERSIGRAEQSVAGTLADLIEELAMGGDVSAYYYMIGFYFLMREITEEDAVILQFYTNYVVNFSNESLSKITQGGLKDQFKSAFGEAYDLSSAGVTAVNPIAGLTMSALKPLAKGTMGELFVQYLNQLPPHKMVMRYFFPRTKKVQLYTDRKQNPDGSSVVTHIENTTPQLNRSLETVEIEDIPAFKKSFLLYIGQLKKDIGEDQFTQKYPLYGFEEWISLSKKQ